jgi:hypothetical protein
METVSLNSLRLERIKYEPPQARRWSRQRCENKFLEVSMPSPATEPKGAFASRDDVKAILGDLDPGKMLAIVELRPTIADVEAALVWLEGDVDVFGADEPLKGVAADIVAILTEGEDEEEPPRAG